ncbi:hypothetical protein LCGC14_0171240 [marine sediment metagenome]|uniref:Thioredoxin domain-containing protein n=1 Tax=marine sediment metagenome TaxID=412755 RepID=A0A0F9UWR0_9ZZZZ
MNKFTSIGIAFVCGGLAVNAIPAISNTEQVNYAISSAIESAFTRLEQARIERENDSIDRLPNILDCQKMQWMENCSTINREAKKNPNAPIRLTNSDGVEFNFVPGTPSAIIRLQLEQSPEAAMEAVRYMDRTWGEYKMSAQLYQEAMWEAGPLENIIGLDRALALRDQPKDINTSSLSLSVFVHSQCGACEVQLSTLGKLQERYPELRIAVFQFDDNQAGFDRKITGNGLRGRILKPQEAEAALKAGVDKWPTVWIDNNASRKRETLSGVRTILQLENSLLGMTHVLNASK